MPLPSHIAHGLRWSVVRQLILARVGTAAVLAIARLLTPAQVGELNMATIVYSGLLLLVQAPLRDAVIFFQADEAESSSAIFALLVGAAVAAVGLVWASAEPLAAYYNFPQAAGLTRGMALVFVGQAAAVVPAALLLKRFLFKQHELWQVAAETVFTIVLIPLLWAGWGAWGVIVAYGASSAVWMMATWWASGFRPQWPTRTAVRRVLRFMRPLLGTQLLTYLIRNLDNAAVGRLGATALGHYSFAEGQSGFVVAGVSLSISQVALPSLAAVQHQPATFREQWLGLVRLTAALTIPAHLGMWVLADLVVWLFFGGQWLAAVPILRAYLTFRLLQAVLVVGDVALSAVGQPAVRWRYDVLLVPLFAGAVGAAVWLGRDVATIGWVLAAVRGLVGLAYLRAVLRVVGVAPRALLAQVWSSAVAAVAMALLVGGIYGWLAPLAWERWAGQVGALAGLAALGVGSYTALLWILDRTAAQAVWSAVRGIFKINSGDA